MREHLIQASVHLQKKIDMANRIIKQAEKDLSLNIEIMTDAESDEWLKRVEKND